MINQLRHTAAGALILTEWLGANGQPVHTPIAERRAALCRKCPLNLPGRWWESAQDKIAEAIKLHLEVKNAVGLHVQKEEETGMCRQCGCAIRLKVWCPITHIKNHTGYKQLAQYPSHCWIKNEITNL